MPGVPRRDVYALLERDLYALSLPSTRSSHRSLFCRAHETSVVAVAALRRAEAVGRARLAAAAMAAWRAVWFLRHWAKALPKVWGSWMREVHDE